MKIENLNTEFLSIGVLFFEDYNTPYVQSTYKELDLVIQAFRPMLDTVDKIEKLIEESNKLKKEKLNENCIGKNETIISFKNGYFQFYSIVLSPEIYLELEESIWIDLLKKLRVFMTNKRGRKYIAQF